MPEIVETITLDPPLKSRAEASGQTEVVPDETLVPVGKVRRVVIRARLVDDAAQDDNS